MHNKCRTYTGAIDNAMGVISKDLEGENVPDIMGKANQLPFSQQGQEKNQYLIGTLVCRIKKSVGEVSGV